MKLRVLCSLIFLNIFCLDLSAADVLLKPRIAILSLYNDGYKHIGQYGDENKERYAKKHGYDVFIYHDLLDATRPPAWSKIVAIQKHLKDYDWIYWSDADSLIMNTEIKLENYIDDGFNLVISKEVSGNLNTGSFLIKNSEWSEELLKKIYEQTDFIHHNYWEQAALGNVFEKEPLLLKYVKILPQRALNSSVWLHRPAGIFQQGDFVIHFFGGCDKEALMREWRLKVVWAE